MRFINISYIYLADRPEARILSQNTINSPSSDNVPTSNFSANISHLQIENALSLNFAQFPCPSRCGTGYIKCDNRKQATKYNQIFVIFTDHECG